MWIVYPEDFSGELNVSSYHSSVTPSGTVNEHYQISSEQSFVQKNKSCNFTILQFLFQTRYENIYVNRHEIFVPDAMLLRNAQVCNNNFVPLLNKHLC
jgi:hypothetical protein